MKMSAQSVTASKLTNGRHPAFLINIDEEPTPLDWQMAQQSPMLWRWYVATWEHPGCIGQVEPEIQSAITSAKFSRPGKFPASNAYLWAQELLQRQIPVGEVIDWDALLPFPCTIKVEHPDGADYVRVGSFEAWPDGQPYLEQLRPLILQHRATTQRASASARAARGLPASNGLPAPTAPVPPADPNLRTWGSAQAAATPPVGWSAPPAAPASVSAFALPREPGDEPDDIPF